MDFVPLSTVVNELVSGKRPKGGVSGDTGTIPSLGGEHLSSDGGFRLDSLKYIDEKFFSELKKGSIRKHDILVVKDGATTGKVSFVDDDFPFEKAAINEHLFSLSVDCSKADPRYVFFFLKSPQGQRQIQKDFRGASIGGISRGFIDLARIPILPLDSQRRVAYLLGKFEALIGRRKQHLQKLSDLLDSIFLEFFGDPVRNEKGWEKKPFSELLVNIDSGKSPKCEARVATIHEWGVLKLGAVTSCTFKGDENKALPLGIAPSTNTEVKAGDVLFSRKNTYELVAACAYVFETRPKLLLPDLIFRFALKQNAEINPIFLWKLLTTGSQRKKIQALAGGAAGSMPNISKAKLKQVILPTPPIDLQNQFAAIVEKVESIKSRYEQSLTDLESLYGALSQKAFNGELDLSRVILPVDVPIKDTVSTEEINHERYEKHEMGRDDFELPAPVDLDSVKSVEGRKTVIDMWLKVWLDHLGETRFCAQAFMDAARQRLWELAEDDTPDWGAAEYDELKTWVFEALDQNLLTQDYDDANNRIQITAVKG